MIRFGPLDPLQRFLIPQKQILKERALGLLQSARTSHDPGRPGPLSTALSGLQLRNSTGGASKQKLSLPAGSSKRHPPAPGVPLPSALVNKVNWKVVGEESLRSILCTGLSPWRKRLDVLCEERTCDLGKISELFVTHKCPALESGTSYVGSTLL